jgi:hypothetical protein
MAGASCCRKAPSMVCVLGRNELGRRGGLEEVLSKEAGKESLNTTPWRLAGKLGVPAGIDLGEVCGDTEGSPRGTCDTLAPAASKP